MKWPNLVTGAAIFGSLSSFMAHAQPMKDKRFEVKAQGKAIADAYDSFYNDPSSEDFFEFYAFPKTIELTRDAFFAATTFQKEGTAEGGLKLTLNVPLLRNLDKELDTLRFVNQEKKKQAFLVPYTLDDLKIEPNSVDARLVQSIAVETAKGSASDSFKITIVLTAEGLSRWTTLSRSNRPLMTLAKIKFTSPFLQDSGLQSVALEVPFSIQSLPSLDQDFDPAMGLESRGFKSGQIEFWTQFRSCEAQANGQLIAFPDENLVNYPFALASAERTKFLDAMKRGFRSAQLTQADACALTNDKTDAKTYWIDYLNSKSITCSNVEDLPTWPNIYFDIRLQSQTFIKQVEALYLALVQECSSPLSVGELTQSFNAKGCFTEAKATFSEALNATSLIQKVEIRSTLAPSYYSTDFKIIPIDDFSYTLQLAFIPSCKKEIDLLVLKKGIEAASGHKLPRDSVHYINYPK